MPSEAKISFYQKKEQVCPICETSFNKEELLSGGGRMNAGELTKELHRVYLPTNKYGVVYPLLYPISVCPNCYFSAFPRDFEELGKENKDKYKQSIGMRKHLVKDIFPTLDFKTKRTLEEGISSYLFAAFCYENSSSDYTPTFKQGLCLLRAAWLCFDLNKEKPGENYDYFGQILYRKAAFFYRRVVELEEQGSESCENVPHLGPDIDNNFAFEGVLYLSSFLEYKYGQRSNVERRGEQLKKARSTVSRIVGMGRSSKAKPSALLELSRNLHGQIKEELNALGIKT